MIAAFFLLKEKVKCFEIVFIALSVFAVLIVVIGDNNSESEAATTVSSSLRYVMYGLLILNLFLSAAGTISMRKMKNFHEAVVSWYLNWTIAITSMTVILILGNGFAPIANFDWISWLLSIGTGLTGVSSQTCRFISLKMQKAAKLQRLTPLMTLWQFLFDVFIFKVPIALVQYCGLAFLFSLYIFQGLKYLVFDLKR